MRQEVRGEPDLAAVGSAWNIQELPDVPAHDHEVIRCIDDLRPLSELHTGDVRYLEEPILVDGAVSALTGDAGSGKSTLITAVCGRLHLGGRPVLILDRENPAAAVADRLRRLGITENGTFRIWGGWQREEAPNPVDPRICEWVLSSDPRPVIVIDSMAAFHGGDENSAKEMRAFLHQARRLTDLGATVAILHHDGKSETARDFRGSSDFKAAVDIAFHVTSTSGNARLTTMVLRCFKHRFGFSGRVVYDYAGGACTAVIVTEGPDEGEAFRTILRENPGVQQRRFEEIATMHGLGRNEARKFLRRDHSVACERGERNSKRYSLVDNHVALDR